MCIYFNNCKKNCKSYKTHASHWYYVDTYCHKLGLRYDHNKYRRKTETETEKKNKKSTLVNYSKYEAYITKNMVTSILDTILDKICYT